MQHVETAVQTVLMLLDRVRTSSKRSHVESICAAMFRLLTPFSPKPKPEGVDASIAMPWDLSRGDLLLLWKAWAEVHKVCPGASDEYESARERFLGRLSEDLLSVLSKLVQAMTFVETTWDTRSLSHPTSALTTDCVRACKEAVDSVLKVVEVWKSKSESLSLVFKNFMIRCWFFSMTRICRRQNMSWKLC